MINGINISEKNGAVDLSNVDAGDIRFVYVKATEAIDSVDRCYSRNVAEAKEKGFLVGAYHWLHPRLHAKQQAEVFTDTVGDFTNMLPPVVCLQGHRTQKDEMEKSVRAFLEIISNKTGATPIIYTSMQYWEKYINDGGWACDYPLWLDMPGSNWPKQFYPWAGWTFWQFSYQSRLPGVNAEIGLNWFVGTEEELDAMVIQ